MNIYDLLPVIYDKLIIYILVLTRVSALFSTFIFFRRGFINVRILIALSAVLSFYEIALGAQIRYHFELFSISMLIESLFQFLIGFLAGMILNIVFEVFSSLGQIVSTQIGLGIASVIDPRLGTITYLTQFYSFAVIILFLMMNGHLFVIKAILDSFNVLPIGESFMPTHIFTAVVNYSGVIFSGSIMLALTVVMATLLTNLALAVLTRFSPQFNIFSVGINLSLIIGLICVYLTLTIFSDKGNSLLQDCFQLLQQTLRK